MLFISIWPHFKSLQISTAKFCIILIAQQWDLCSISHFSSSKLSNVRQKQAAFLIQKIYFALEVTCSKYCNWPPVYWFSGVPWSTSACFLRYNSLKDSETWRYIIIWGEDDEDQRGFSLNKGKRTCHFSNIMHLYLLTWNKIVCFIQCTHNV